MYYKHMGQTPFQAAVAQRIAADPAAFAARLEADPAMRARFEAQLAERAAYDPAFAEQLAAAVTPWYQKTWFLAAAAGAGALVLVSMLRR